MKLRKGLTLIVVFVTALSVVTTSVSFYEIDQDIDNNEPTSENEYVEYHFIDVGQADATLIISPEATKLIDTGGHTGEEVVNYLHYMNITDIDLLVGTHPHADHIGQTAQIIEEFEVQDVWMSGYEHDSQTYEEVYDAIEEHNVTYNNPRANETYQYGSVEFEVINPVDLTEDMDIHESCLAFRTVYGNFSAMFTGDVEWETEHEIIDRGHEFDADVYQAGHHGSSTSSSEEFVSEMDPDVTIYSSDPDVYGHPHDVVVDRMDEFGIDQYGTNDHGTIKVTAYEDGEYELTHEKENLLENEYFEDWVEEDDPEHWELEAQAGQSEFGEGQIGNYSLKLGPHQFIGPYSECQEFTHEEADGREFTYQGEIWVKGTGYIRLGILRPGYTMRDYSGWHIIDSDEWTRITHETTKDDREGTEGEFRIQHTSDSGQAGDDDETLDEVDALVGSAWLGTQEPYLQWPYETYMELDLDADEESNGWNFVSFNLKPVNKDVTSLLGDIDESYESVMYYDAETDEWLSYIPGRDEHFNHEIEWDETKGLWIQMSSHDTLVVRGEKPDTTNITLKPGWNMVGYPSGNASQEDLPDQVTKVGYFNGSREYNLAYSYNPEDFEFRPGNAYWLYNDGDEEVTWTVNY